MSRINRLRTADEPIVNPGSSACFVILRVQTGIFSFVIAKACAEADKENKSDSAVVCIQEFRAPPSCWDTIRTRSRSALLGLHKSHNL